MVGNARGSHLVLQQDSIFRPFCGGLFDENPVDAFLMGQALGYEIFPDDADGDFLHAVYGADAVQFILDVADVVQILVDELRRVLLAETEIGLFPFPVPCRLCGGSGCPCTVVRIGGLRLHADHRMRVGLHEGGDCRQEFPAVFRQLIFAHAGDVQHVIRRPGQLHAHVDQGLIVKDNVRRQRFRPGDFQPELPQLLEQVVPRGREGIGAFPVGSLLTVRLLLLIKPHDDPGAFLFQRRDIPHLQHAVLILCLIEIALLHQLADQAPYQGFIAILQRPVGFIMNRAQLPQPGPVSAQQSSGDDGQAVAPPCLRHTVDDLLCFRSHVRLLIIPVAIAAVVAGQAGLLAEVVQDIVPKTTGSPAVPLHDLETAQVPLFDQLRVLVFQSGEILFFQQKFIDDDILCREQQNALGRLPVPPGAPGLLVVVFHALGHVVVDHIPDVGLVDAHAERVGGHDDGGAVIDEVLLVLLPGVIVKARVVPGDGDAPVSQRLTELVHVFPGGAVNNPAFRGMLFYVACYEIVFPSYALHAVVEILSVEAGHCHIGIHEIQDA